MPLSIGDTVRLASGAKMPLLGLGTYRAEEGPAVERAVTTALRLGYRSIDTASLYGNEASIGRALRTSGVPRTDVFLATKVWNDEQGYSDTLRALRRSLDRLGTDYVDLYLVHWPVPRYIAQTWRAMEELHRTGKAKAIGVCNFLVHHLDALAEIAEIAPMVNQFEFHPQLQQPGLVSYCRKHAIQVEAWAPTMRGGVLEIPELVSIGEAHRKTAVQVTLRWMLMKGIAAIPKSVHPQRVAENCDIFDFELTPEEADAIDRLDKGHRIGPHPDEFVG
jgi:diketogulonate reductase-like aldo/keto reductase